MERTTPTSFVTRKLESGPVVLRQVFLLLVLLREMLLLLLALIRGDVSLEDARAQLHVLQPECASPSHTVLSDSRMSDASAQDSESTCDSSASERLESSSFVSAIRILCRDIVRRDQQAVARTLDAVPRLVGKRHEGGWFALHAAVLTGDVELVRLVLAYPKTDVNAVFKKSGAANNLVMPIDYEYELGMQADDTSGATPLHYACMTGNAEIIRLLVERGALFKAKDDKGREPVEYFNIQRDLETVSVFHELYFQWKQHDQFFKGYNNPDDLAQLIRDDNYEPFEFSVKRNPSIASKMTYYDFTLLHLAVIRQRRRFVELLISMDQSLVNKRDRRSSWSSTASLDSFASSGIPHKYVKDATPLHYACLVHDMDIAEMLLAAGADWNTKDRKGRLPEDLIHAVGETMNKLKDAFTRLCDAEDAKRRTAEEERRKKDVDEENDKEKDMDDDDDQSDHSYGSADEDDGIETETDCSMAPAKVSIESLLSLEKAIGEKLVGQRGPIRLVASAIRLRESQWVDPDRPLTLLFLGSSGVGKTELAKQLALYLHGKDGLSTEKGQNISKLEKDHGFVRIDMSEFMEQHTVMNLIGAPKSYVGYGEGGALTQPLKKNPKAVVLLDEIEKAHPDVLATFLQVFDDGRITDSKDGVISCKDAIFIMTSNIAAEEIKNAAPRLRQFITQSEREGRPESYIHLMQDFTRSIRPQLKHYLKRDEFVGRINQIVVFLPLSVEEIEVAVRRELELWARRSAEKHKITMVWTDEVVRNLAASYDVNYGVRSVANEVQRIAVQLVADAHIRGQLSEDWHATLTTNEVGDIVMNASPKVEEPTTPEEPANPEGPVEPEKPADPEEPVKSEEPPDPEEPPQT